MPAEPHLRRPSTRFRASFVDAVAEFRAEGLSDRTRSDQDLHGDWASPTGFAAYVRAVTTDAVDESRVAPGRVPSTRLWWTHGERYLGRIDVRHRLTPALTEVGGHIGYAVRPSARRQGHATAMLTEALVVARALGVERALVTCDADNVGSRRVIEHNGGRLEDQRGSKLRFWIET
ncbi:GNAT family N-acetyltransferase [Microlunatus flavus]|uniref:Predicted acetyltransferase n=1 Tax=Microlunatus flavus TaxID=1036181 RepID=A0A1H9LUW3_9ACTN|nr:GNAT family N-acetyltransferase [Microlunatus flavus]SER15007.1 Predicted acetyltransferase [Microlunatus flavus]